MNEWNYWVSKLQNIIMNGIILNKFEYIIIIMHMN